MLNALWFIVKFIILAGALAYLISLPGTVAVATLDYQVDLPLGYLLAGIIGLVFFSLIFFQILDGLVRFPVWIKQKRERVKNKKGQQAILRSLSALAAGDAKIGYYQAWRAASLLPQEQNNLPLLLQAQAAQMKGEKNTADEIFTKLLDGPDTAFLGLRGLLRSAATSEDYVRIRSIAETTRRRFPKQPWLVRAGYDMKLRQHAWSDALDDLRILAKTKLYPAEQVASDRAALFTSMGQDAESTGQIDTAVKYYKRALKHDSAFLPASYYLADLYRRHKQQGKMVAVIRHIWPQAPCLLLASLWGEAAPAKNKKIGAKLQWFEQLFALNETSYESHIMMAQAALDEGFHGQAGTYLTRAERIERTVALYQLKARLEKNTNGTEDTIEKLLIEASRAQPDRTWTCQQTHRVLATWQPLVMPEGLFNTVRWKSPPANTNVTHQHSFGLEQAGQNRPAYGTAAQLLKPSAGDFSAVRGFEAYDRAREAVPDKE